MITIFNNLYCKKLLFLLKNQEHPEQFHKKKKRNFLHFIRQSLPKSKKQKKNRKTNIKIWRIVYH